MRARRAVSMLGKTGPDEWKVRLFVRPLRLNGPCSIAAMYCLDEAADTGHRSCVDRNAVPVPQDSSLKPSGKVGKFVLRGRPRAVLGTARQVAPDGQVPTTATARQPARWGSKPCGTAAPVYLHR